METTRVDEESWDDDYEFEEDWWGGEEFREVELKEGREEELQYLVEQIVWQSGSPKDFHGMADKILGILAEIEADVNKKTQNERKRQESANERANNEVAEGNRGR